MAKSRSLRDLIENAPARSQGQSLATPNQLQQATLDLSGGGGMGQGILKDAAKTAAADLLGSSSSTSWLASLLSLL